MFSFANYVGPLTLAMLSPPPCEFVHYAHVSKVTDGFWMNLALMMGYKISPIV